MKKNQILPYIPIKIIVIISLILIFIFYIYSFYRKNITISPYPYGKNFAFTITADPDYNKLENDRILYDFFTSLGIKTTIAVWVKEALRSNGLPDIEQKKQYGDSCEREEYLKYMQELQSRGFEIALHTVSPGNDYREQTIEGYEFFNKVFGKYPTINIMHSTNLENIYWGKKVINNSFLRLIISFFASRSNLPFEGEIIDSKYFWGDLLKKNTKYVRLWGTSDINTLKFNPSMPYHDADKPYVNYWFSFTDGKNLDIFNKLIEEKNINSLRKERGASIVYVHFASGFIQDNKLNNMFKERMTALSKHSDGWFVPATTLLNRLLEMKYVKLEKYKNKIFITNYNGVTVYGLTVMVSPGTIYFNQNGDKFIANEEGEIVIEKLLSGDTVVLSKKSIGQVQEKMSLGLLEEINALFQRSLVYIKHNW